MASGLIIIPNYMPALDSNGRPISGALMYFYLNNTTTPQAVYSDSGLTVPLSQPVVADISGVFPAIYADTTFTYSVVVTTALGAPLASYSDIYAPVSTANFALTTFVVGTRPNSANLNARFAKDVNVKTDFGAAGTNLVDDASAITAAINYANAQQFPVNILFPPGVYRSDSALPKVGTGVYLIGGGQRQSILAPNGSADFLTFGGTASKTSGNGMYSMGIAASSMTAGAAVSVDWSLAASFRDVLISGAVNGLNIRQAGNITIDNVFIDAVRGIGLYAYGTNTTRNGENDQIDIIDITNLNVQGLYVPGGSVGKTSEGVVLDGRVQTVTWGETMRLLSIGRGIRTSNTPGVPSNLVPSFLLGNTIEIENTWLESMRFEALTNSKFDYLFSATSVSENGIYMGAATNAIRVLGGSISNCWQHGLLIDGANALDLCLNTTFNSQFGSNAYDGVNIATGNDIVFRGGRYGKNPYSPTYTERQRYGINNVAGTNVRKSAINTLGNVTAGINGTVADNTSI